MLNDRLNTAPLLVSAQAAFTQDDEAGMKIEVEKVEEVLGVDGHDCGAMLMGICPDNVIGLAAESDMGNRMSTHTHIGQPANEGR